VGEFVKVARLADVPEGGCLAVEVRGRRIALFNLGGTIHATDDTCTHAEASLCAGHVSADEVVCPLHGATFDIRSGRATGPPASEDLAVYRVRVAGGRIEVEA
jgi:nitrite reductase/ring-hydroxylating ferredoxin subunit